MHRAEDVLTNNSAVREEGVKQLFLDFPIFPNSSVEVLVQGSNLASNREIKKHGFFLWTKYSS